jgi:hypothetical protein
MGSGIFKLQWNGAVEHLFARLKEMFGLAKKRLVGAERVGTHLFS